MLILTDVIGIWPCHVYKAEKANEEKIACGVVWKGWIESVKTSPDIIYFSYSFIFITEIITTSSLYLYIAYLCISCEECSDFKELRIFWCL